MTTLTFVATLFVTAAGSADRAVELSAAEWINPLTLRVPEDRTYVLLLFTSVRSERVEPYLESLERLRDREDVLVLGLSPESPDRVRRFVEEYRIRFPVGARSRAYRDLKVREFPAVVVLRPADRKSAQDATVVNVDVLDRYIQELHPNTAAKEELLPRVPDTLPIPELRRYARHHPELGQRLRALDLMRARTEPREFMQFCDELLDDVDDSVERGNISYRKHLADPSATDKEPLLAPSSAAVRDMRKNPDDPRWTPVRDYAQWIDTVPADRLPDQLISDYYTYWGDDPANLLIRREVVQRIETLEDKPMVKSLLKEILPEEPDATLRMIVAGGLWQLSEVGDLEMADFLEQQLARETNVRSVQPLLETAVRCLRTGDGPCEK